MRRALLGSLVLAALLPAPGAQGQGKRGPKKTAGEKNAETLTIEDKLSADDPKDKVINRPHKVHTVRLMAGKTYQLDLWGRDFDCYLRVEDASGKPLAEDDTRASAGWGNTRILFNAPRTGSYRIIAGGLGTGPYRLIVKEASAAAVASAAAFGDLAKDFEKNFISSSKQLHKDYAHARTDAEKDKLLGDFTVAWKQYQGALAKIAKDARGDGAGPRAERMVSTVQISVGHVKRHIAISGGRALQDEYEKAVEAKDRKADELYRKVESYLVEGARHYAGDAELASEFKDQLYLLRHLSVGRTAPEIEGEDLDGKKFKLSDYRGKVVVLSFWAFW
jgi:hypothetical protein